ncbi:MAG: hypothetical protein U9R29_01105, partial [Thermodesulfobacteriota bacterium]|nr:hypothetical protein [Thermodesulfobacteriota bacterium]
MKKNMMIVVGLIFLLAGNVYAESDVKGTVLNLSNAKNAANVSIGKDNTAKMGSVGIKNSAVKGTVLNLSNAKNAANVAIGKNNTANMG